MRYPELDELKRTAPAVLARLSTLPELVTYAELAGVFNVTIQTVRDWTQTGYLPRPLRIAGRNARLDREQVRKAIIRISETPSP